VEFVVSLYREGLEEGTLTMGTTTIQAGIEDALKEHAWFKAVAELYPDAALWTLPNGTSRWASPSVVPTDLMVVLGDRGERDAYAIPYALVGKRAVFRRTDFPETLGVLFMRMGKQDPELLAKVVAYAAREFA
jgi:hypothetical protein